MGRWTVSLAILGAAGCGEVKGQGADAAVGDANRDGAADSTVAACDLAKPFGAAVEVPGLNDAAAIDTHATLTSDELTVLFASNRADHAAVHIYSATRADRNAGFGTPQLVASTFSTEGESHPSISPDGNTIFFDSFRVQAGTIHIFTSTRSSAAVVFPTPTMITGDALIDPAVSTNGNVLYAADLSSGGLVRLDKAGGGFGTPQGVALSLASSVVSPVTNDDLTLYMSFGDTTGNEIAVSGRTSTSSPWGTPVSVAELKTTTSLAEPSWLSPDGCRLYLTYAVSNDARIFMATRPR